ncbi:pentatricopeptide repeat-containing protein At4g01990, mitochondrial-like [Carex rostrata]
MWKRTAIATATATATAWRLQVARRVSSSSPSPLPFQPRSQPRQGRPVGSDPLFLRLSEGGSVGDVMEAWLREKKPTSEDYLFSLVREFRRYGSHSLALQLIDWMDQRGMSMTPGTHAVRLDLIAYVKGMEEAEDYFSSLPPQYKTKHTYGALLYACVRLKLVEKSLSLFSKMQDLNLVTATLPYNNLLSLFLNQNQPHKVPELFAEMKTKGISPDTYSYSMLARSYVLMNDADSFEERVVKEVRELGDHVPSKADWNLYATFASVYVSFGKFEQAELELKKLEERMNKTERKPYQILITSYAGTGNKEGVIRIWESLKKQFPKTTHGSYIIFLNALSKFDDIDAIKRCFKNWESEVESGTLSFYIRIPNAVIGVYLKNDMLAEAQVVGESCVAKGHVDSRTVDLFLEYYLKNSKLDLAWYWFDKGVELGKKGKWKPEEEIINAFVKYFEESADRSDQYELFREKLKEINSTGVEIKDNEVTDIA